MIRISVHRVVVPSIPIFGQQLRQFSATKLSSADTAPATTAETWEPPPHPSTFSSPKVEELYFKLISLPNDELQLVSKVALLRIGIDVDKENEAREAFLAAGGSTQHVEEAAVEEVPVEAKTSFDLKLLSFDASSKIKVIKEVRAITNLGLKEAKEMVEGAPKVIRKGMKEEEAQELMKKLIEAGAAAEIV